MAPRASVGGSTLKGYSAFNTLSRRELKCPLPVSRLLRRLKGQSYDQFDEIFWALDGGRKNSLGPKTIRTSSPVQMYCRRARAKPLSSKMSVEGRGWSISRRQAKKEEFTVSAFSGDELSHLAKRGF